MGAYWYICPWVGGMSLVFTPVQALEGVAIVLCIGKTRGRPHHEIIIIPPPTPTQYFHPHHTI